VFALANEPFTRLFGGRELIGRPFRAAFPELVDTEVGWILDDVYASGEAAIAGELPARAERWGAAHEIFLSFLVQPISSDAGRSEGLLAVGTDVTAQVAARRRIEALERRSAFLAEASAALALSLEPAETLAMAAHLVVHNLADWCAIDLVIPDDPPGK